MVRRILKTAGAAAVVALLAYAVVIQGPSSAQAAPPLPCPASAGVGTTPYRVFATLPIGTLSSGVCITPSASATLNTGSLIQAPPACPALAATAVDAGANVVWADWGVPCVAGGQTVVLQFFGAAGIPLGRQLGAANWGLGVTSDATVWPADCPAAPVGTGPVLYNAVVPVPLGGPFDGVCINILGAAGQVRAPLVLASPPSCGAPSLSAPNAPASVVGPFFGAAANQFWVDWTAKCALGGSLSIQFKGPAGLVGVCTACATWLGSAVTGNVTITLAPSVGGVAEAPDAATVSSAKAAGGSGVDRGWYVATASLLVVAAGAWYMRRRRSA